MVIAYAQIYQGAQRMKIKKIFISTALACSMTASILFSNMSFYNSHITYAAETEQQEPINVAKRSKQEIKEYIENHPASISDSVTYAEMPNPESPYKAGSLSNETLQSSLNIFNHVRYIAGLSEVTLNDTYNKTAQTSAVVVAADTTSVISHFPAQPSDMPNDFYQLGADGAKSSNIGWGSWEGYTLNDCIVNGWMDDGDEYNIDRLGHRRWVLNPSMSATGFGVTYKSNAPNIGTYLVMYAFDRNNTTANERGVSWPAQTMPVEYFGKNFPWSISFGVPISDDTTVKLTNTKSGKVWNFSKNSADGDFYISNDSYGQRGCVIFRPSEKLSYESGDSYRVEISNLGTSTLKNDVTYNVDFFSLNDKDDTPEITEKYGDVDNNGEVNSSDAVILKKYLAHMKNISCNEKLADINHDGKVDSSDAVLLLKHLAGYNVM